jgi:hypothetical protein
MTHKNLALAKRLSFGIGVGIGLSSADPDSDSDPDSLWQRLFSEQSYFGIHFH